MIKKETFLQMIDDCLKENPCWRYGQAAFNIAWDCWPGFVDKNIRGNSNLDPFYANKNVQSMIECLIKNGMIQEK